MCATNTCENFNSTVFRASVKVFTCKNGPKILPLKRGHEATDKNWIHPSDYNNDIPTVILMIIMEHFFESPPWPSGLKRWNTDC